jgi:hypothetical protein
VETLLAPLFLYWWFLAHLEAGVWLVPSGVVLLVAARLGRARIKSAVRSLPRLVRASAMMIGFLGVMVTLPPAYFYAVVGRDIAAGFGASLGSTLRSLLGAAGGVLSVAALIAWASILWCVIGGVIGFALFFPFSRRREKAEGGELKSGGLR